MPLYFILRTIYIFQRGSNTIVIMPWAFLASLHTGQALTHTKYMLDLTALIGPSMRHSGPCYPCAPAQYRQTSIP